MNRIVIPLSLISIAMLAITFVLGMLIDDPKIADPKVQAVVGRHFLVAMASLSFTTLVHAVVFTYFMGTGRWIEETSNAYQLSPEIYRQSQRIKYPVLFWITAGFLMLLATGAFGAAADPASPAQFKGWFQFTAAQWHQGVAIIGICTNAWVHFIQFQALEKYHGLIEEVLRLVKAIRVAKGLAVD